MINRPAMKKRSNFAILAAFCGLATSTPLLADDGGMLKTIPRGTYQCALPGDAAREPLKTVEAEGFAIKGSSSYSTATGRGTYLLRGKILTFTSGPKRGQRYRQTGTQQLQKLERDGSLTKMICARIGS
jgi:hypothetical protein